MKSLVPFVMIALLTFCSGLAFAIPEDSSRELDEALFEAAERNDAARIRQLLKQGASIHAQDGKGQTALLAAVDRNHIASARRLIEAGSDVNVQDRQLDSPLLLAGARGYLEILKLTLQANPDFTIYNRFGGTALIPACERGHVEVVRELLQTDVDINHVNRLGWTALLEAIILSEGVPDIRKSYECFLTRVPILICRMVMESARFNMLDTRDSLPSFICWNPQVPDRGTASLVISLTTCRIEAENRHQDNTRVVPCYQRRIS
ncbi:MAG: ankyrin repeat domain-containing protein [Nitrospirales bacterium]|nr:ankyrin repeat domain-containing protein [Nitrospirales bacterium]